MFNKFKQIWNDTDTAVHSMFYAILTWSLVAVLITILDILGYVK